jgi:hypothetical protein
VPASCAQIIIRKDKNLVPVQEELSCAANGHAADTAGANHARGLGDLLAGRVRLLEDAAVRLRVGAGLADGATYGGSTTCTE